jgi:hypothetical protein
MRRTAVLVSFLVSSFFAIATVANIFANQDEDPWKKFERKGGRQERAQVIQLQDYELTAQDIAEGRNLKLYEQGGHLNCFSHIPVGTRKEADEIARRAGKRVAAARRFILSHWDEHRRGYIRLSFDSVDANATSHIFIEPDSGGKWQVIWRIVRSSNEITTIPILRSVIRDSTENKLGQLIFKDSEGDELKRL